MTLTTQRLSEPFGKIAYQEAGQQYAGQQAPVVLIHGVGMQSEAWRPQLEALGQTHHVIAFDLPGHGMSDGLPADARLPEFVDWVFAVLNGLQLPMVNLAGHSMGALIASGVAVRCPQRVARVALLNGVFRRDQAARSAVIARAEQIGTGQFDLETPLNRWFGDPPQDLSARARVAQWLSTVNIDGYATAYRAFAHGDSVYADGFSAIRSPFLAITGDGDLNSTPAMSEAMARAVLRGRALVIKGHGHMVNLTAPEAVNKALKEWLQTPLEEMDAA